MNGLDSIQIHSRSHRHGAALVFGLMGLLVASMMLAAMIQMTTKSHRQLKRDEIHVQANLLADAGCRRCLVKLLKQPDFKEEVWKVPADQLQDDQTAIVHSTVQILESSPEKKSITVTAEYPAGHPDRVRITRRIENF